VAVLYRNQGGWTPQADNFQGEDPIPLFLGNYTLGTNGLLFAPQGGLRISPSDLARILILLKYGNFQGIEVVDSSTIELMQTPQWTYDGDNGDNYYGLFRSWGLGVHCTTDTEGGDRIFDGSEFKGHPGEAYGLISDMYWFSDPNLEAGFIFMTNGAFNGFEFGEQSAYYSLEEEVFQAVCSNNFQGCFLGVEELDASQTLEVFPNPSRGIFSIIVNIPTGQNVLLTVHNALGCEVVKSKTNFVNSFDFSGLTAGMYTLTIEGSDGVNHRCQIAIE
jgi:hypothetical protein